MVPGSICFIHTHSRSRTSAIPVFGHGYGIQKRRRLDRRNDDNKSDNNNDADRAQVKDAYLLIIRSMGILCSGMQKI